MKGKKFSFLKDDFFLRLFVTPSICWIVLALWIMILPTEPGEKPITWLDFFEVSFLLIFIWFIISLVIALIVNEIKKTRPKTKDDKIVNIKEEKKQKEIKKSANSNFINIFMIILFIVTLCSLWGALWSWALINEIHPYHGFDFTKSTWVFWCWLPIPFASIILGFKFNRKGFKCTKNIVAGFIIGFFLLIYGSFCLIPTFSEDYSKINDYKEYIDANIPNNGELEIQNWGTYFDDDKTEYVIINAYYDNEEVSELLNSIVTSNNWVLSTKMKSELKILLPSEFGFNNDAYYSVYNKTTNEYNTIPSESGKYEIYAMYYNKASKQLSIHKYNYQFNA